MKQNPYHRSPAGFTLIELIVAMAILSVILLLAMQVTEVARTSVRVAGSKALNDEIARQAFDQIGCDLTQMLVRGDARIEFKSEPGNDRLAFLTNVSGLTAVGRRPVALVTYAIVHDKIYGEQLLRGSLGHQFDDAARDALHLDPAIQFPPVPQENLQTLSANILRFEIEYLMQGTTGVTREITAPTTTGNLRGLVVTLATLDDRSRRAVRAERLPDIAARFADAVAATNTLEAWSKTRDEMARYGSTGLPKDALQSIHCYQRTFLIQ